MASATRKPRTKPPEARRAELLDAAERLFLRHGFAPTTVEQITDAAGVAKGTFYLYFASKDELRETLGERYGEAHLQRTTAAVAEVTGFDAKLTAWVRSSVEFYLDSIELHDMLFYQGRSPTREGLVDNLVTDQLEELLLTGVAAGACQVPDARAAAVFLFGGVHAVVDEAVSRERRVQRPRLLKRITALVAHSVRRARSG
jgi:AcrR family transcriptional regulator